MPKAKTAHLIVREIDDETLVYDMGRHAATCLNEFAAKVWRGTTVRRPWPTSSTQGEDERAVWLALHRLNGSNYSRKKSPCRLTCAPARPAARSRDGWASGGRSGGFQHRHDDGGARQLWDLG